MQVILWPRQTASHINSHCNTVSPGPHLLFMHKLFSGAKGGFFSQFCTAAHPNLLNPTTMHPGVGCAPLCPLYPLLWIIYNASSSTIRCSSGLDYKTRSKSFGTVHLYLLAKLNKCSSMLGVLQIAKYVHIMSHT